MIIALGLIAKSIAAETCSKGHTHYLAANPRATQSAIAVGYFGQVLLMIVLGIIKSGGFVHPGGDGRQACSL